MDNKSNTGSTLNVSPHSHTEGGQGHFTAHHPSQASTSGEASELDKLFAKIEPTPVLSAAVAESPAPIPHSTSKMTVDSLFAALGGGDIMQSEQNTPSASQLSSGSTSTGLSLLDSIFASASNISSNGPSTTNLITQGSRLSTTQPPVQLQAPTIYSPTPSVNVLPQVLNQDVISTLLGLPPSRTGSAASTAYSSGAHSHPSSREGDNEDDGDISVSYRGSDEYSESSTVLDPDAEFDDELQAAGASAGRPLLGDSRHQHTGINGLLGASDPGGVHGDVTPRAPLNGFITPPLVRTNGTRPTTQAHSAVEPSSSVSTVLGPRRPPSRSYSRTSITEPHNGANGLITTRPLVPFEADSELWPYPRAPVDEHHADSDGEEIIELDFGDTSALSDPDAFKRASKNNKKHLRGGSVSDVVNSSEGARDKGRKKGKKERAAEQLRLRQEIENSWDVPGPSAHIAERGAISSDEPASPSPCPSPEPSLPPSRQALPRNISAPSVKTASFANGTASRTNGSLVDPDTVRESLISTMSNEGSASGGLERNEFVREILTLIHVRPCHPLVPASSYRSAHRPTSPLWILCSKTIVEDWRRSVYLCVIFNGSIISNLTVRDCITSTPISLLPQYYPEYVVYYVARSHHTLLSVLSVYYASTIVVLLIILY